MTSLMTAAELPGLAAFAPRDRWSVEIDDSGRSGRLYLPATGATNLDAVRCALEAFEDEYGPTDATLELTATPAYAPASAPEFGPCLVCRAPIPESFMVCSRACAAELNEVADPDNRARGPLDIVEVALARAAWEPCAADSGYRALLTVRDRRGSASIRQVLASDPLCWPVQALAAARAGELAAAAAVTG